MIKKEALPKLQQKAKTSSEIDQILNTLWKKLSVGQRLEMKHYFGDRQKPPSNPYLNFAKIKWISIEDAEAIHASVVAEHKQKLQRDSTEELLLFRELYTLISEVHGIARKYPMLYKIYLKVSTPERVKEAKELNIGLKG